MGISPDFKEGAVSAQVEAFRQNLGRAVLTLLKYLGEDLVRYARDNHNYTDRTGNLTSSIGYVITREGKIVFDGIASSVDSRESALRVARQMAADSGQAYTLIIVAGMSYASYVEAKGYNVILPAELKAKKDFPAAMERLTEMAKGKANELFGGII